jgi:hypothetical protein
MQDVAASHFSQPFQPAISASHFGQSFRPVISASQCTPTKNLPLALEAFGNLLP